MLMIQLAEMGKGPSERWVDAKIELLELFSGKCNGKDSNKTEFAGWFDAAIKTVQVLIKTMENFQITKDIPENCSSNEKKAMISANLGLKNIENSLRNNKDEIIHKLRKFTKFMKELKKDGLEKNKTDLIREDILGLSSKNWSLLDFESGAPTEK